MFQQCCFYSSRLLHLDVARWIWPIEHAAGPGRRAADGSDASRMLQTMSPGLGGSGGWVGPSAQCPRRRALKVTSKKMLREKCRYAGATSLYAQWNCMAVAAEDGEYMVVIKRWNGKPNIFGQKSAKQTCTAIQMQHPGAPHFFSEASRVLMPDWKLDKIGAWFGGLRQVLLRAGFPFPFCWVSQTQSCFGNQAG